MALINKPYTAVAGQKIKAADYNNNFDTIYNDYNGNITNANISANANISDTKLAQITTAGKVAAGAVTDESIDLADVTCDGVLLEEQSSAPSTAASTGALYTKDVSGQPELFYREESDGDEVQITDSGALNVAGKVLQVASTISTTEVTTSGTAIPKDNTTPQNTEGDEIYATNSYTPTSATSNLLVTGVLRLACNTNTSGVIAVFKDSDADAIATFGIDYINGGNDPLSFPIHLVVSATDTSARQYKFRVGNAGGDVFYLNRASGGSLYNGTLKSTITITEIAA